jgi:endonuclease/exonuclease/phosphatase (EEP) superfamily protein YafD
VATDIDAGNAAGRHSRTHTVTTAASVAVWAIAIGYGLLVLARYVAFDNNRYLAVCNAQTLWLFLPAYIVASAAWCFRRVGLACVATVAVAFHAITVTASIGSPAPIPAAAAAAPQLRVLTANVKWSNPTKARLARELLRADADVVALQEVTPIWLDVLEELGFDDTYPFRISQPREDSRGMALYSRYPLSDAVVLAPNDSPTITARVTVRGRTVSFVDVHAIGPPEGMTAHRASVAVIRELARRLPKPRVLAGDFNATPFNRTMLRFHDLGLDSVHRRRGRGLAVTWPNGHRPVPPVQLDHVLVDASVVVLDVSELSGIGSDHKPVLTDLALM